MRRPENAPAAERFRVVRQPMPHDSAIKHAAGQAAYVDDIATPAGTLHVIPGLAPIAAGRISSLDLEAVQKSPDVVAVLTAADIPGLNDAGPHGTGDAPFLASGEVSFYGQVLFAVVARSRAAARRAVELARIGTAPIMPLIDIEDAVAAGTRTGEYVFQRGEPGPDIDRSERRISGQMRIGGQEHFYLEPQGALAIPGEDGDMLIHASAEAPALVQEIVARMLGRPANTVTVEVRRLGGGFGGKIDAAAQWAGLAALAAWRTGRPCKLVLDRDDDMRATGKSHDFRVEYRVGFSQSGVIRALDAQLAARCGAAEGSAAEIVDRAMFHADNGYYYPFIRIAGRRLRTNTVPNTRSRGLGAPAGMLAAERMLDHIAYVLGQDPLDVRKANLYGGGGRDRTPYGFRLEDNMLPEIVGQLERTSDYRRRRSDIQRFNEKSPILKKGLALTPVKFGVGDPAAAGNQGGALVQLYRDGSLSLAIGGVEAGQGLFVKCAQVVAEAFGVGLERVRLAATSTARVPNMPSAGPAAGVDLNAQAALAACRTIKDRLFDFMEETMSVERERVEFRDGAVHLGSRSMALADLAEAAWTGRVSLSATGYYRTPRIAWDRDRVNGRPFFYFVYGAACSEVTVDTMTGEMRVERADILQDAGRSLNTAIDLGLIEGGFVQGMGWLTSEELVWDSAGRLRTLGASTYKIPTAGDVPREFRVEIFESGGNREETIHRSKEIGEASLALGISVFCAIANAIASLRRGAMPRLDAPATPEAIMRAVRGMADA